MRDFAERETAPSFASFGFQPLDAPHHVADGVTLLASSGGGFMHNASCNLHFPRTDPRAPVPYCAIRRYDDPVRIIPVLPNVDRKLCLITCILWDFLLFFDQLESSTTFSE